MISFPGISISGIKSRVSKNREQRSGIKDQGSKAGIKNQVSGIMLSRYLPGLVPVYFLNTFVK